MFDALFAFEGTQQVAVYPDTVEIPELSEVLFLTSPHDFQSGSSIYVFNTETTYFFTWAFEFNSQPNALVIATSKLCASLYFDFLKAVAASFKGCEDVSDCLCRFGFVKSLLLSWAALSTNELRITYPLTSFTLDIGSVTSWIADFNVGLLYPRIEAVWRALITGKRIVVHGTTPELASSATCAALSLVLPLVFTDKVLLYTDHRDERSRDQSFVLIGTSDPNLRTLPNSFLVEARGTHVGDLSETQHQYQQKTGRYYSVILCLMDLALMANPYCDMLEMPVDVNNRELPKDIDISVLRDMQSTASFRRWRRKKMSRDSIRAAFLSMPPSEAVQKVPPDKYDVALEQIDVLKHLYASDQHFLSVLKAHEHELRRLKKAETHH